MEQIKRFAKTPLAAALLGIAFSASAQDARMLEEVIVTATKRAETVQDIPASISALTGNTLSDRGLVSVSDLSRAVPNLNWGEHFGTNLVTIRGVGSTVDSGITEPTVAMYVDGVFLPRATMATLRAVDLERVEVLRGPQGTLYGRNATGGAINFISKAPSDQFEGGINLSAGDRDAWGVSGYVSGPINDIVSFRLSGGRESQDGYVKVSPGSNRLGGTDVTYGRAMLRIVPTDDLMIDLAVRNERNTAPNAWQQLIEPSVLPTAGQTDKPNRIIADSPYRSLVETTISHVAVEWDITDSIALRSLTSYVDHKSIHDVDADATDLDFYSTPNFFRPSRAWAQELILSGDADRVDWVVGAFWYEEEATVALPLLLGTALAPGFGVPDNTIIRQAVDSETMSYALFTDVTFSLTDNLRLIGGLRYNYEEQDFRQDLATIIPGLGAVRAGGYANGPIPVSTDTDDILPKLAVQYDVNAETMVYAQYSKGIKSGGMNLDGSGALPGLGYEPEEIDAYEVGLKTRLLDSRLTANFAAFYYDYEALQVTITRPPNTTLVNNADAKIFGLESEFVYDVTDQLRLELALTYTDATFDGFSSFDDAEPALGVQDLDGEPLPHAPKYTANLGIEYFMAVPGPLSQLTLRADVNYSDDVTLRYFTSDINIQDAYTLGSVSARLADADGRHVVRVYADNIGDVKYKQNVTYLPAQFGFAGNYAEPFNWGVQYSYRF